ncbi:MAG: hypothetical protein H6624_17040 [Bdellovibrionaceae bacterium]|nr:hypothetical protein [Bdellovibrionales bacterium]MCB9086053.1 hypothetical protein [Pseudobdellovibrionaceae bacterium]
MFLKAIAKFLPFATLGFAPLAAAYAPANSVPIFFFEKSHNNENILVVHSAMSPDCRFEKVTADEDSTAGEAFLVDFYWLMERDWYKPTHPLIKAGIRERLDVGELSEGNKAFSMTLADLKEVLHDLPSLEFRVESITQDSGCRARAIIALGASHSFQVIELDSIYTEVVTALGFPTKKFKWIEIRGRNISNGAQVVARFYPT